MISNLSGGQVHDAPENRALLESWDEPVANAPLRLIKPTEATRPTVLSGTWG